MNRILEAISGSPPPPCLHDSTGEVVFLVPWAPDRVRRGTSETLLRKEVEMPIIELEVEPLDSGESHEETD
jgi:hypothetical protein